jgi:protein-tyrosine kinase
MHTYFGRMSPSGTEPAPEEPHDFARMAQQIRNSNLFILSGDSLAEQQLGPAARDQLAGMVLQLRDRFDYVLVEAPPIARFHEGLIFGQMSDGLVLVVEANATRREIAKQTKERLQAADVKLLGTVLNNRTYPIPQKLYARL